MPTSFPRKSTTGGAFVSKVKDISEFLMALGPIAPRGSLPLKVTYHDACHLCHGQQIRSQPRALLAMIPGLELVPLDETEICCGAAGTYNLAQPEMSERLGRRKMDHIEATGAKVVATGNVGCIMQIARKVKERGKDIDVVHPIDLLDRAYRDTVRQRAQMSPAHFGFVTSPRFHEGPALRIGPGTESANMAKLSRKRPASLRAALS